MSNSEQKIFKRILKSQKNVGYLNILGSTSLWTCQGSYPFLQSEADNCTSKICSCSHGYLFFESHHQDLLAIVRSTSSPSPPSAVSLLANTDCFPDATKTWLVSVLEMKMSRILPKGTRLDFLWPAPEESLFLGPVCVAAHQSWFHQNSACIFSRSISTEHSWEATQPQSHWALILCRIGEGGEEEC